MKRLVMRTLIAVAILLLIALVYVAVNVYNHTDDAYAQWGAANMVIDYMRDHDGDWPPDWDSLARYFAMNNGRVSGWSYADFQSNVFIDFSADADSLRKLAIESDAIQFDVIHATSVWGQQFEDGPNGMLYRYLRNGAGSTDTCP